MKPVVLLGASGYVGSAFRRFFAARGIPCLAPRRSEVDYTRPGVLREFLGREKPGFLVNCAGFTGKPNVDACEDHKWECLMANAALPGLIGQACAEQGVMWGHVSSGCIYTGDGPGGRGFSEEDESNFSFRHGLCSFYSGTKALGEEVLRGLPGGYLWRLRIPFGPVDCPRNYLTKVMRYERLLDARNSLSELDEFVRAAWECHERGVPLGIYNMTNPGSITTCEVVDLILKAGVCRKEFLFFADETEFMRQAARTPRSNCVLDTAKLQRVGIRMTEIHEAMEQALKNWRTA